MTPGPDTTALRLSGRDALDLLHRISTQSLADLAPGAARVTMFCDFRARMLHRAIVARTTDGAVWLLREDAPGAALAAHLDQSLFREDVQVSDLSGTWFVHGVANAMARPGELAERDGVPVRIGIAPGLALEVVAADAPRGTAPEAWERARIAAGWPRAGHEVAEDFHPFEVGRGDDVHLRKGCYTGQEVLMRLVTYQSVRRGLARVAGDGPPPATPAEVRAGEERAGVLTSTIAEGGGWVGLAVLTTTAHPPLATSGGVALTRVERMPVAPPRGLGAN